MAESSRRDAVLRQDDVPPGRGFTTWPHPYQVDDGVLSVSVRPPGASTGCPLTFSVDHGRSPLLVSGTDVRRIIGLHSPPQEWSGDSPVVTLVSTLQRGARRIEHLGFRDNPVGVAVLEDHTLTSSAVTVTANRQISAHWITPLRTLAASHPRSGRLSRSYELPAPRYELWARRSLRSAGRWCG